MELHPHEVATIRAFAAPARRERLLQQLANPRRREAALDKLNHFTGWDDRYAQTVPTSASVLDTLKAAGAPAVCHVISCLRELDGQDLPLADAVARAQEFSFASILCCDPGRLAFFFDEDYLPRPQLLLRRPGRAS